MRVLRYSQENGARKARGLTVIIDVFRAFTCEPLLYHLGVDSIIIESDINTCLGYSGKALLIGEQDGRPIEGFDLGNSPWDIMAQDEGFFTGRTILHRTTSGVSGAVAAFEHSETVLLASFVNARATTDYILNTNPELVSIVAMGVVSVEPTPEDEFCGNYIESLLTGTSYDHVHSIDNILASESAQKFLRGDKSWYPKEDPVICLQRDLFDFALKVEYDNNKLTVKKITVDSR
ncbi:MAG: 2-phosphosulfolactate phosphatase [Candidatus Latescibacteria bacterium]|nr:2-phosphosulfolactate phosphatase [Candidatus Latescibacterota bacterium]